MRPHDVQPRCPDRGALSASQGSSVRKLAYQIAADPGGVRARAHAPRSHAARTRSLWPAATLVTVRVAYYARTVHAELDDLAARAAFAASSRRRDG
jgi:hypothetical protein